MKKESSSKNRRKGAISKSYSALTTHAQLEHLDGLSYIHRLDVESNWKLLNPQEADAEREHAALLESYYFGGGKRYDLICNYWFGDDASPVSKATVLLGADLKSEVIKADAARRNWRDGERMRSSPNGEMSGNLGKVFARLPPWVATEAGKFLERADLGTAVLKLARKVEKETGLKVLAATVHRESDHDLHVHFVVSKIRLVEVIQREYSPAYLKKLLGKQREIVREQLSERGEDTSLKAVKAELERRWSTGEMTNPEERKNFEYQTIDRSGAPRRALVSMGQQHCSKTNLWEASGRDPAVAAVQEKHCNVSFRAVVQDAAAVAPDGDPAHKYFDLWLAKEWTRAVCEQLPQDVQNRIPEAGRMAAHRYVLDGSSLPNPALDAIRLREKEIIDDAIEVSSRIRNSAGEQAANIISEARFRAEQVKADAASRAEATSARAETHVARTRAESESRSSQIRAEAVKHAAHLVAEAQDQASKTIATAEARAALTVSEAEAVKTAAVALERDMMTPPTVLETAEKLGFMATSEGIMEAVIAESVYSLKPQDDAHILSRQIEKEGKKEWQRNESPIRTAQTLISKIWPKLDGMGVIEKIVSLFPRKIVAIVIGLGLQDNPKLWSKLLPSKKLPEPQEQSKERQA